MKKAPLDLGYTKDAKLPKLQAEVKEDLANPITRREVSVALNKLKGKKAPGVDGLPAEFYNIFWLKLRNFITELLLEVVNEGELHLSVRHGVITLIEKLGKDSLDIANWHPISLLCTDYKIYAKNFGSKNAEGTPSNNPLLSNGFHERKKHW